MKKLLIYIVLIVLSNPIKAQDFELGDPLQILSGGSEDANVYAGNYISPLLKGLGYGMTNGWYNSGKAHKLGGFDLTISGNMAIIPKADRNFIFNELDYNNIALGNVPDGSELPTIGGGGNSSTQLVSSYNGIPISTYDAPVGVGEEVPLNAVPTPILQLGIGLVKKTEVKLRWMPAINTDRFKFNYWGVGVMHNFSQYIPVFKNIPGVDLSALVGYTSINFDMVVPEGVIAGTNQKATSSMSAMTFQVIGSAHVSVITGYVGFGYDQVSSTFNLNGTYNLGLVDLEDPVGIDIEASGLRALIGARLKFAVITLHADYTIREYNTLNIGFGINVR